ncbi:50S ribosomal protein L2 [Bienertia sinuspersici]
MKMIISLIQSPNCSLLKTVPIWIQLHKLDLRRWGEQSLAKIAGIVGQMVKSMNGDHFGALSATLMGI